MKKTILTTLVVILGASFAQAGDLYCGANTEKVPGSQTYDKLVFWEKMDTAKTKTLFILKDGTVIHSENLTLELMAQIADGATNLGVSFPQGKPQLFIGKVKRNKSNEIQTEHLAMAGTLDESKSPMLLANGVSLLCREQ